MRCKLMPIQLLTIIIDCIICKLNFDGLLQAILYENGSSTLKQKGFLDFGDDRVVSISNTTFSIVSLELV